MVLAVCEPDLLACAQISPQCHNTVLISVVYFIKPFRAMTHEYLYENQNVSKKPTRYKSHLN